MEDNVFDITVNADKSITYRVKLYKLLEHCMQEIAALNTGLADACMDENTYLDLTKRIQALQQRQQFYENQLNMLIA